MPSRSFRSYTNNSAWGYQWCVYDNTCVTDRLEWMALVNINQGRTATYDGQTLHLGLIALVGKVPAVPGSIASESHIYVEGQATHCPAPFSDYTSWQTIGDYYIWVTDTGSLLSYAFDADYNFNSYSEFQAACQNGEIYPTVDMVYFDVYINGSDQPNIFVNWTATNDLSIVTMAPEVYIGAQCDIPLVPWEITDDHGVTQPNTAAWHIDSAGSYNYGGSFQTSYISIADHFSNFLNPSSKVLYWGLDGIPDYIILYLRMDDGSSQGGLYRIIINKDGSYTSELLENSSYEAHFNTVVRFHTGEPDYVLPDDDDEYAHGTNYDGSGDGRYAPDTTIPDFSPYAGQGFDGNAVLTTTYAVSAATLQNIGQKLWSQSYFDVLKIQSNPIENIISVKAFPFASTGSSEDIQVGDISFGINGDKVASVKVMPQTSGYTYTGKYGNYLDLPPYTTAKINLPYIGLVELNVADLFESELKVQYVIDLVTGQCMAMLTLDGVPYMNCFGQMGVDIPLTATDRVQTELRAASSALSAVNGVAGHVIAGDTFGGLMGGASNALSLAGIDLTSQRTCSLSPACSTFANHAIFILIERPMENPESTGYKHLHGYPCHKYVALSTLASSEYEGGAFIQVDHRTDINIGMTSEENRLLESLLTQGVYLKNGSPKKVY